MKNVNGFDRLYRRTIRAAGVTGALVRLSDDPIQIQSYRVLSHVSVENQTTLFTKLRLGIHNRGVDYFLDELQIIAADELCVLRSDIVLGDGDRFFSELTGTTDSDVIVMNLVGWEAMK